MLGIENCSNTYGVIHSYLLHLLSIIAVTLMIKLNLFVISWP